MSSTKDIDTTASSGESDSLTSEIGYKAVDYSKPHHVLGTSRTPWYGTTLVLLSEIMGTGILGLPSATVEIGWVAAIIFLVVFAGFAFYSGYILSEVHKENPTVNSFGKAAEVLCAPWFGTFTHACMLICWGALAIYFLIATSEALSAIIQTGPMTCAVVRLAFSAIIISVPAQCRDFHTISQFLSGPSTLCVMTAIILIVAKLSQERLDNGTSFGDNTSVGIPKETDPVSFASSTASFCFAYQGQSIYFELMTEMNNPTLFPRTNATAYLIIAGFYFLSVVAGYGLMGADVPGFLPSVLEDGPTKTLVGMLVLLHVTVSYVIAIHPVHVWFHSKLFPQTLYQETSSGTLHWGIVTVGYIAFAFLIANLVPYFEDVQKLLGVFGAPMMFGWPPLFFIMTKKKQAASWSKCFQIMGWFHCSLCFVAMVIFTPLLMVLGSWGAVRDLINNIAMDVDDKTTPFSC